MSKIADIPEDVQKLYAAACEARKKSYSPYSKFAVGAAFATAEGQIISGCNIENSSYGLAICAERAAIAKAISDGYRSFSKLVIVSEKASAPCGACRQVIQEFVSPQFEIWLASPSAIESKLLQSELLPHAFVPTDLPSKA